MAANVKVTTTKTIDYIERLRQLGAAQNEFGKAEYHPSVIDKIMFIPTYKQKHANMVKIINGKQVVWDSRTNKAYDEKVARKFIEANNKKLIDDFNLKNYKTLTPYKDIEYLEAVRDLENYKKSKNSTIYNIRKSFSTKIVGDDGQDSGLTVHDVNWEKDLRKHEQKLLELKSGTSFEAQELKELKNKSKNYVKPEVKEEVKVETPMPEYKPNKTYEGTFIQGAFVGKETTPKKRELMINMP